MSRSLMGCVLLALVWVGTAHAQRVEDEPGYIDLSVVADWFDTDPTLEVNVKGALLKLVAEASRYEDPELAALLFRLKSIQVRGFELSWSEMRDIASRTSEMASRLEGDGWDTVVRYRDDDERVHMYAKVVDEAISGLVVMVVEPGDDDTVFLNIVGEIDPEEIGRIGRKFNIGRFEDW